MTVRALDRLQREREFFRDSLLVRIHFIIVMIRWIGLAPREFEFPFPGCKAAIRARSDLLLLHHHRSQT